MTKLEEVYESFLSKISDYNLISANITEEELNDELFGYFKKARTKFYKCENSLELVDALADDEVTIEKVFTVELHPFEIEILSTLMVVEYMKPQLVSSEVIKQSLSDKDFKIYSQANQLRELNLLYRMLRTEAGKMITEYTYINLEDTQL